MRLVSGLMVLLAAMSLVGLVGCQQSSTTESGAKKLTLTKPSDVTIKPGETAKVSVSIKRTNFRDPVMVLFEGLPAGVTVEDKDQKIAAEATSAQFTLKAAADAKPEAGKEVKVVVESGSLKETEPFKVTIKGKG